jgi:hypothetical protein
MEPKKKKSAGTLARIIGSSVMVKTEGGDVLVPTGPSENKIANMILASQMRHMIQAALKTYSEKQATLTPKEIKDMADAAKAVASFSAEVYATSDGLVEKDNDPRVVSEEKPEEVSFENLTQK